MIEINRFQFLCNKTVLCYQMNVLNKKTKYCTPFLHFKSKPYPAVIGGKCVMRNFFLPGISPQFFLPFPNHLSAHSLFLPPFKIVLKF